MAQQVSTTDPATEFNALLARAQGMVSQLVSKSVTSGTFVQGVQDFQISWNGIYDVVGGELNHMIQEHTGDSKAYLNVQKGSIADAVLHKGLKVDGKYGPATATALVYTLWAKMGIVEEPSGMPHVLGATPTDPRKWPQTYAANRAFYDSVFLPVTMQNPPLPSKDEVVVGGQAQAPKPGLEAQVPVPSNETVFDTNEGVTVKGRTQGSTSLAPILAIGAGATVLGGILWFSFRKKKGR